ncbi:MAG: hypothetical protein QG644_199, partial [Patescibacteria group bacterium]|nr:hypothetical protein [Patescibacteria group bacterium]
PDGRYVVFSSSATNLVAGDTNASYDAFIRDLQDGTTERVSIATAGTEGNAGSNGINISSDGRYVLFTSGATNLVAGDTNGFSDLFIRDRQSNTTERVSLTSSGGQPNSDSSIANLSQDGRYIIFNNNGSNLLSYDTNGANDLFIRDTLLDTTEWAIEFEDSDSTGLNGHSYAPRITEDNKYVVFYSEASNIITNDNNSYGDVFVFNRLTREYELVSVATDGTQGNNTSYDPVISDDGRYVAFASNATNLVPGDTNALSDIFLRDLTNNTTTRISVSNSDVEADSESNNAAISSDGKYIVFYSEASNLVDNDNNLAADIFLYDVDLSQISRISVSSSGVEGSDGSEDPSISADGRYVTFESWSSDLVEDDSNGEADIFLRDTHTNTTVRVSANIIIPHGNGENVGGKFSDDDRFVVFDTNSSDLVPGDTNGSRDVFVVNRSTGGIERVSVASDGTEAEGNSQNPYISSDGRYVTFSSDASNLVAGDTNAEFDVFIKDRQTGEVERISVSSGEVEANNSSNYLSAVSSDGRYVAFASDATNLVAGDTNASTDIFIRDVQLGNTERISVSSAEVEGTGYSSDVAMSNDGNLVFFNSSSSTLVADDTNDTTDVFMRNVSLGTTERISVSSSEIEGTLGVYNTPLGISSDGRYVVFSSDSEDLVTGDSNLVGDVFIRDIQSGTTELISLTSNGTQGNDHSIDYGPSISPDGRYVVFYSNSTNLVSGDTNALGDVFIRDRQLNTTERVSLRNDSTEIPEEGSSRPDVSSDGRYVLFDSGYHLIKDEDFNNEADIFIRDRELETTDFVINLSPAPANNNNPSYNPKISGDGNYVVFQSSANRLIPNDSNVASDVFIYTRGNGEIELLSKDENGLQGDQDSVQPSISSDGRYVGFYSYATNLVADDTNATADLFVLDRETDEVIRAIRTYAGGEIGGDEVDDGNVFMISPDGAYVVFSSNLTNLVQTDTNARRDIFLASLSINSSDSGGGRSILSSGGGGGRTKVKINENTELPIPSNYNGVCEPYLPVDTYLSRKRVNNPDTVMKLQRFLSLYGIQYDLPSTGYYGPRTEKAVKDLQYLYFNEILGSQGFKKPTGIVAGYTAKKINAIVCFQSLFNP